MDKKPPVDFSFFIPILIGLCSIFGIVLVLLGLRLSAAQGAIQTTITNTPVQFQYLGTEPAVALPTEVPPVEEPTEVLATPTEISLAPIPPTATEIVFGPSPIVAATTPVRATNTVTPQSLGVTYDDTDSRFLYTGNWIAQSGVNGTYRNTLHISSTIGDAVQFGFYGQKLQLVYQSGPSLGTVAIKLDATDAVLDQSSSETSSSVWESAVLPLANHTITITHISGGSINIDSAVVIDINTPTPTATLTSTP